LISIELRMPYFTTRLIYARLRTPAQKKIVWGVYNRITLISFNKTVLHIQTF